MAADGACRAGIGPRLMVLLLSLGAAASASAHPGTTATDDIGGLVSGFMHPLAGWDHLIAIVAVGLWASLLGARALRRLPALFLLIMALAGLSGAAGLHLPAVEPAIAVSVIVLGVLVATALRPSLLVASMVVGGFAVAHGHAHGLELPQAASLLSYSLGFLGATALLLLAGVGIGGLLRWPAGVLAVRAGGGAITIAGLALLTGIA
jgi:urease accessory protein